MPFPSVPHPVLSSTCSIVHAAPYPIHLSSLPSSQFPGCQSSSPCIRILGCSLSLSARARRRTVPRHAQVPRMCACK